MKIETILQKEVTDDIMSKVILYKNEMFTYFDSGLTRYVFVNKDKTKVIKILINPDMNYNQEEFEIYENASEEKKKELAETFLTYDGMIIEQEFCSPIKWDERKLKTMKQIMFASSCRNEVGWNKNGDLVCFDLNEYKKY